MDEEYSATILSVPEGTPPTRLDKLLATLYPDLSRSRLKSLILDGNVEVSGHVLTDVSYKVGEGQEITLSVPPASDNTPQAQDIPLEIVYEDDDLLVVNKAVGMVVHPGAGNHAGTLVNALLYHCGESLSGIGGVKRPGIVHRLDKETSGLLVVAKHEKAHQGLSDQLKDRTLSRIYTAFIWRVPTLIKGHVDAPIGRHPHHRLKMSIQRNGRDALTHYHVQETYRDAITQVACKLESGRTHQIRVHMQSIKHPLIGDPLYGLPAQEQVALLKKAGYEADAAQKIVKFPRQALHASEIGFIHPISGEEMRFKSDLPQDLLNLKSLIKS
ncbi:MAG: RluA family pseudouridine synthase [Alphaproteobacteria bacterium]|nr:RluA family pseudouridine synthase [Alphaproteobacteria bacterium]